MYRMHPVLLLLACANPAMAAPNFVGAYAPASWSTTGILGGFAEVDLASSSSAELVLTYDVDLGTTTTGVSFRTAMYETTASADAAVTFDWSMVYDARIHQPRTELYVYAEGPSGALTEVLLHSDVLSFGSEYASGVSPTLNVYAGRAFGIRAGGGNVDSDSRISGTITLTGFDAVSPTDCAGTPGGSAVLDMCGTCDANPSNDCVQDCRGDWGGAATVDNCNTCDAIASNDCAADCNGTFGGLAVLDMCNTCDSNPGNDCVQDCSGTWGGTATTDACGQCDSDASNDCVIDCNGMPGGSAVQDLCGHCDSDPSNDCVADCNGVPGGPALEDDCGECDSDPGNDCVADCNGDYDGLAYIDDCGDCVEGNTGEAPCEPTSGTTSRGGGATTGGTTSTRPSSDPAPDNHTGHTADTGVAGPTGPVTYTRAGCGCASGTPAGAAWLVGVGLFAVRRRR